MPFAVDGNPTPSEISDALNYLLSNFNGNVSSDPNTGQVTSNGSIVGYLYKYMAVKYADSFDGTVNFNNSPTNRQYYGLRNTNSTTESTNPADYIWYKVTGGFGTTKYLWYICTGGRQIQFQVALTAPDTGWVEDTGAPIDLDVVTSGNIPVIAEGFSTYFTPAVMQVPRTGSPLAPVFTNITPVAFSTNQGSVVPFTDAQTDSNVAFVNNSWRIGNSSTTGNSDIAYTNITIGTPVDMGDYVQWPAPSAMSNSPAYIQIPVRYKNSLGVVTQASVAICQLLFVDPGAQGNPGADGAPGSSVDISGFTSFTQNVGGAFTPPSATLSALLTNITAPTYSWTISGATPATATTASVVVTPLSSSTGVTVTLTVSGTNLASPLSKTIKLGVVYDGTPGAAGANGLMSAFPTIYQWTGSSTPPTRPTTTSTYTWSTGSFTPPTGWYSSAPSNTVPGNFLWSITYPITAVATATTAVLDWTDTANPIRSIAYNGINGTNGLSSKSMTLLCSAQTFTYDGNGTLSPTGQSITFTANPQNLTTSPTFTATKYNAAGTNIGSATLTGTGNTRVLTAAAFDVAAYCVVTASADGYSDTITIVRLQAGTNAIVGYLTNESATVFANTDGTVPSFAGTGGSFIVYNGLDLVPTSSITYSVVSATSITITINSAGVYAVTAMSADYGYATLRATYGTVQVDKVYSISKSKTGTTGNAGAATFVIVRAANDASQPTNAEVNAAIGRDPVAGDICTLSYNSYNNAEVWRYSAAWALFSTYITGSLIVENTITSDKLSVNQLSAIASNLGTITGGELTISGTGGTPTISGTTMTGAGSHLYSDGRFALGNSTTNIVFNGTNAYLNGFSNISTASSSGIVLSNTDVTVITFTLSKSATILYGCSGTYYAAIANPNVTPTQVISYMTVIIYDSSNVQKSNYQIVPAGPVACTTVGGGGPNYFLDTNISGTNIVTLSAGTYTLKVNGVIPLGSSFTDNAGNAPTTWTDILHSFGGRIYVYQASI